MLVPVFAAVDVPAAVESGWLPPAAVRDIEVWFDGLDEACLAMSASGVAPVLVPLAFGSLAEMADEMGVDMRDIDVYDIVGQVPVSELSRQWEGSSLERGDFERLSQWSSRLVEVPDPAAWAPAVRALLLDLIPEHGFVRVSVSVQLSGDAENPSLDDVVCFSRRFSAEVVDADELRFSSAQQSDVADGLTVVLASEFDESLYVVTTAVCLSSFSVCPAGAVRVEIFDEREFVESLEIDEEFLEAMGFDVDDPDLDVEVVVDEFDEPTSVLWFTARDGTLHSSSSPRPLPERRPSSGEVPSGAVDASGEFDVQQGVALWAHLVARHGVSLPADASLFDLQFNHHLAHMSETLDGHHASDVSFTFAELAAAAAALADGDM